MVRSVMVLIAMAQIEVTLNDLVRIVETLNAKVAHSYQVAMVWQAHYAVRYVVLHCVVVHCVAVVAHSVAAPRFSAADASHRVSTSEMPRLHTTSTSTAANTPVELYCPA